MATISYFDYAAATPLDDRVRIAMEPYFSEQFFNPSGISLRSRDVLRTIQQARHDIATTIGATDGEIVFTAGGTEANNLAIHGVMRLYPHARMVISAVEHDSVALPARHYTHQLLPVNEKGRVLVDQLDTYIDDQTVLLSCIYASNEIGTIQPLRQIMERVAEIRRERVKKNNSLPLLVHIDACQAASHLDMHVSRLGVDLMTVNGGKIYGPKQSGFLYVRSGVRLVPLIEGGGQENGLRSGTQNVAAIVGLATAFTLSRATATGEKDRLSKVRNSFEESLQSAFPEVLIHGDKKHRLPHFSSVAFPGVDNERLLMMLDERNVIAAAGSACHAAKGTPSTVLRAMGVGDDIAASTIRWTFGRGTTADDTDRALAVLKHIMPEAKTLS